jgi:hypothetical protein
MFLVTGMRGRRNVTYGQKFITGTGGHCSSVEARQHIAPVRRAEDGENLARPFVPPLFAWIPQ